MQDKKRGIWEVSAFAKAMLYTMNLKKNAIKGDWKDTDWRTLLQNLKDEVIELQIECIKHQTFPNEEIKKRILLESTDVACSAMMLADKFSSLSIELYEEEGFYEMFCLACIRFTESILRRVRRSPKS